MTVGTRPAQDQARHNPGNGVGKGNRKFCPSVQCCWEESQFSSGMWLHGATHAPVGVPYMEGSTKWTHGGETTGNLIEKRNGIEGRGGVGGEGLGIRF